MPVRREVLVNGWCYAQTLASVPGGERVRVYATDITERKAAEEALRASLREKKVLLKEIHHRVKNNLQVISSLVGLQTDTLNDPNSRALFRDVCDRVRSMARVHKKLYQSNSLAGVDFAEYAHSLVQYLWRAHGVAGVRINEQLEPVRQTP